MLGSVRTRLSHEDKQQAAIEAAQDPSSPMTADKANQIVRDQAKAAGAQAFSFDPHASPEEKAAQARANIPLNLQTHRHHQVAALATDQDDGTATAGYDLPSPTKSGAIPVSAISADEHGSDGHDYSRVGFRPQFGEVGKNEHSNDESMLDHQTWLEGKLDEKFFGDWYHNAAVIVFACLSSWTIAVLGGGLGWVFLVVATCGTYYRTSIRRVRRNVRDDIYRELQKARLEDDTESLEWINSFMVKFWPIYAPVLCSTIVSSVDQVLSTSTPAFLDSMRMKLFTLGTKPPRLEHVKTYPKANDDIVMMDWKFSFTPNDVADMTQQQIKHKTNPKIILEVRLGKAMISTGLDVIVEDMAFSGMMRVKLKLQLPFPHIERAEICFLDRPTIDYVCKPLGGETFGFDINFVPGLETFIMEQIHANLGPMMYAPNVFPIEVAKLLAGNPVDQAVGVLQIVFHGATGLKNTDKFAGTPDPYAVVAINDRQPIAKTRTVPQNPNPRWTETVNIILTSLKDNLTISVFDYNDFRKDKELGRASFALEQLEIDPVHENYQFELVASGRPRGHVQADVRFFPVLEGENLPDGTQEPPPESSTGIAKFTVECAKELDGSKSLIGSLNPYAVLLLNGKEVHVSKKLKRTNNPIWPDATHELLITDRKRAKLGLVIKDDRDMATDPIIGTYQIKLNDMLDLMSKGQEWYNMAGASTGKVKMQLQWRPVAMTDAIGAYGGYMTPIGVIRLHFKSAQNLKNVETMGKSDPYVRVMLSGIMKGRTVTFSNNLNPEWDEVVYVPIHNGREKLLLEVMDEQDIGKDRPLGFVEILSGDYVDQDPETGEYHINDTKQTISVPLTLGSKAAAKGVLNYTASFFPTINVLDPEEEERENATPFTPISKHGNTGPDSELPDAVKRVRSGTVGTISSLHSRTVSNGAGSMRRQLSENAKQQSEVGQMHKIDPPKVKVTVADLDNYECGLIVFKIIDGEMAMAGCYLEVIMDDNAFPAHTSAKTRSKQFTFNEIGDAMVRELDLSMITLRLVSEVDKKGEGRDVKNIRAKLTGSTIDVLRKALYNPTQLTLKDVNGQESLVTISMKFLPVKMKLDPSESVNNSGNVRVEVLDAADLPAMDRNGYSDPYCKFFLQGKEVYKSEKKKKTLNPTWNEFFELPIRSRTAAKFEVRLFDWDFGDKADFLGKASINLDILQPFERQEVTLALEGKSGSIRLAFVFKPDYVTRSRQGSSTFSGTFAALPAGRIAAAPAKGVGKGAAFVGSEVAKGASFLKRGFKGKKDKPEDENEQLPTVKSNGLNMPPLITTSLPAADATAQIHHEHLMQNDSFAVQHNSVLSPIDSVATKETPLTPHRASAAVRHDTAHSPQPDSLGTAYFSIVSAVGFPAGSKLEVRLTHVTKDSAKVREVLKTKAVRTKSGEVNWEDEKHLETKRIACTADTQFRVAVYDHGTFGGSETLGEAFFIIPDENHGALDRDDLVAIKHGSSAGSGSVVVRSRFDVTASLSASNGVGVDGHGLSGNDAASIASGSVAGTAERSGLRRSFMGRRERSTTPGT